MLAVIQSGAKQFLVSAGDKIKIPRIAKEAGETVKFEVLFFADEDEKVFLGDKETGKAEVTGKVLSQELGEKVKGVKHKPKKRYLVHYGHRQPYTQVEITSVKMK